ETKCGYWARPPAATQRRRCCARRAGVGKERGGRDRASGHRVELRLRPACFHGAMSASNKAYNLWRIVPRELSQTTRATGMSCVSPHVTHAALLRSAKATLSASTEAGKVIPSASCSRFQKW